MAHRQLGEQPGNTLQTTALGHEAYLKLVDSTQAGSSGRASFFAAAARAMRQVLVDGARRRTSVKRGEGATHVPLDEVQLAVDEFAIDLLELDDALRSLAELNPRHARVVECIYFGGLNDWRNSRRPGHFASNGEVIGLSPARGCTTG